MERKKALATAASISAIALAGTIALGANVGLFGLNRDTNGPGTFKLVDATSPEPLVRTEIVDVPVPASDPGGSPTPSSDSTDATHSTQGSTSPSVVGTAPRVDDDHGSDDHGSDDHDAEDDSHESGSGHDEDD